MPVANRLFVTEPTWKRVSIVRVDREPGMGFTVAHAYCTRADFAVFADQCPRDTGQPFLRKDIFEFAFKTRLRGLANRSRRKCCQ
jgi:hypothetical protein